MELDATYVLGVDGGGSGCRAAVAGLQGAVLGEGSTGPANATTDFDQAVRNVRDAIAEALAKAELNADDVKNIHVGLAGIMSPEEANHFAAQLPFTTVTVTDDRPTSLAGALGANDGVLAALGTGSFIGAQTDGKQQFIGGWGLQVGDHASGAWLGRALLEQVLLVQDGLREATPLSARTFGNFQSDPNTIVTFARDATPAKYAALAFGIFQAADDGDALGLDLVKRGVTYIESAFAHLSPKTTSPLCLTGGLAPLYTPWLTAPCYARLTDTEGTALDGTLHLAKLGTPP